MQRTGAREGSTRRRTLGRVAVLALTIGAALAVLVPGTAGAASNTATEISALCHWSWCAVSATEMRKRWRRPSTIGRMAARFDLSDRLSGTWRSKLMAAACTDPF